MMGGARPGVRKQVFWVFTQGYEEADTKHRGYGGVRELLQ